MNRTVDPHVYKECAVPAYGVGCGTCYEAGIGLTSKEYPLHIEPLAPTVKTMTPGELSDLAFNIADRCCADLIDSCTNEVVIEGPAASPLMDRETWRSFANFINGIFSGLARAEQVMDDISDEIDYLEARGLLHRHPEHKHLVRIEEGARG